MPFNAPSFPHSLNFKTERFSPFPYLMTRSQETGFGLQEKEAKMNDILATCYSEKEKNDVLNTQGRAIEEEKLRLQDEQEKLMAIAGEVKRAVMYRFSTG